MLKNILIFWGDFLLLLIEPPHPMHLYYLVILYYRVYESYIPC